jgi:hypothetical protein
MMRGLIGRTSVLLVALAVLVTGLDGAYRYWQSYYQHRGFTPVRLIAGAHSGHRLWVHFYSTALHRRYDYLVYLPPGYDPAHHRYPVFYLLHGSPGRPQVYTGIGSMGTRMDNLIHRGRMAPMILVFPDGRVRGSTFSDAEWANTRSGRYESYVLNVVHDVDHRFAAVAHRGARVIAGFSSGPMGRRTSPCITWVCSATCSRGRATTARRARPPLPTPLPPCWPPTARWTTSPGWLEHSPSIRCGRSCSLAAMTT